MRGSKPQQASRSAGVPTNTDKFRPASSGKNAGVGGLLRVTLLMAICLGVYYSFLPAVRYYYRIEDPRLPPLSTIGKTLADESETPGKFIPVAYQNMSPWMITMMVAAEDQHFF